MNGATILGCGIADDLGIAGTRGIATTWNDLGMEAPGTAKTMRTVFDKEDTTFRRIDLLARALVLACEASDLETVLTMEQRQDTAICIETDLGALATDLSFASSLGDECVHAGIFPYSLTSTCLGEVALRYKLRGPTISMSVRDDGSTPDPALAGESLRESLRMLACGDVEHVVTGCVDAILEPTATRPAKIRAVVAVLARGKGNAAPRAGSANAKGLGTVEWPDPKVDPFQQFVAMCR